MPGRKEVNECETKADLLHRAAHGQLNLGAQVRAQNCAEKSVEMYLLGTHPVRVQDQAGSR